MNLLFSSHQGKRVNNVRIVSHLSANIRNHRSLDSVSHQDLLTLRLFSVYGTNKQAPLPFLSVLGLPFYTDQVRIKQVSVLSMPCQKLSAVTAAGL